MSGLKIGRNDPCPCGSGKKYKKCCALLGDIVDIALDPFTRCSQLMSSLKLKLDDHYSQRIKKMRTNLKDYFLRYTTQAILPEENESFFSEWLWFGSQSSERPCLGAEYLQMHEDYMDKPFKEALAALNNSFLSVYEVKNALHQYLEVEDIFTAQKVEVLLKEPWDADINENPSLLLGRLVQLDRENIFSGMVSIASNRGGEKEFLQRHVSFIARLRNITENEFLHKHQEMLFGLFDHALKQVMVTFDHMEAADLKPEARDLLLNSLHNHQDWKFVHRTQGYDWFKPNRDRTGYVRIAIGDSDLVWSAEVLDDIEHLRDTINLLSPGLNSIIINNRYMEDSGGNDYYPLWFLVVRDRETEKWLHTPHFELGNHTPAQLLEDDSGRARLQQMLDDYLANSTREGRPLLEYMQERIRECS